MAEQRLEPVLLDSGVFNFLFEGRRQNEVLKSSDVITIQCLYFKCFGEYLLERKDIFSCLPLVVYNEIKTLNEIKTFVK